MSWEPLIVFGTIGLAAGYTVRWFWRAFQGSAGSCVGCSKGCRNQTASENGLVQLSGPRPDGRFRNGESTGGQTGSNSTRCVKNSNP